MTKNWTGTGTVPAPIPDYIEMGWRDRAQERKRRAEGAAYNGRWCRAADDVLRPYGLRLASPDGRTLHIYDERLNRRRISGSVWDGRKMIWRKPTVRDHPHPLGRRLTAGPKVRCAHRSWHSARQMLARCGSPPIESSDTSDPLAAEAFLAARGHLATPALKRAATILNGEVNALVAEMRDRDADAPQKPRLPCWWDAPEQERKYWSRIGSPPGFRGPISAHPAWRWIAKDARVFRVESTWFELRIPRYIELRHQAA